MHELMVLKGLVLVHAFVLKGNRGRLLHLVLALLQKQYVRQQIGKAREGMKSGAEILRTRNSRTFFM
jgi:hypothetical protein